MTSPATDEATRRHFEESSFFGLKPSQVVFFQQGVLPALTEAGKVIMESRSKLAMAPDGNGGVYVALRKSGVLDDMAAHSVEAVDCYCVDNALVTVLLPMYCACGIVLRGIHSRCLGGTGLAQSRACWLVGWHDW